MFSDKTLEKIFADERTYKIPIIFQTIMIKVVEEVLENENDN